MPRGRLQLLAVAAVVVVVAVVECARATTRWRALSNAATCSLPRRTRAQLGSLILAMRPLAEGLSCQKTTTTRKTTMSLTTLMEMAMKKEANLGRATEAGERREEAWRRREQRTWSAVKMRKNTQGEVKRKRGTSR